MVESDKKILERIQKRRDQAFEAEKDRRAKQLEDVEFCDPANQWPEGERAKRKAQSRPCLTVDRTNPFIDQLVNEERQNRPSATVNPINDGADQDTAEIIQGYFRHVEMNSNADFAYDRASESQKRGGFGFIRVMTDYVDETTFDQDIKIGSVPNPFMYYLDPASTEPDGSDSEWGFGEEDFTRDDFKASYPKASLSDAGTNEWQSVGDAAPGWLGVDGNTVRIVEYYELQHDPITLCLLEDGTTKDKAELAKGDKVTKERPSTKTTVKWFKVCANEILERSDRVPGRYIPIVPVYGKEMIINGKRDYRGVVRGMKDVQRMINVWKSAQTEAIGLAPRAPWIVALGSLPDGDKTWSTANTTNHSSLFYKAYDDQGRQLPTPARNIQEPAIQAITVALRESEEDMKAVTGMYDPARGLADSSSQSGVAIKSLQRQGMTSNFHFSDNFNRSLRHVWRIALYMMPEVIDAERLLRIVGIDDTHYQVKVNTAEPVKHPKTGVESIFDLTAGKYDVSIVAGPSYQSKRQENTDQLMNLAKMIPMVGQLGADILVRQMDFPAAKELAERVTPPQFKRPDEGQPQMPPQAMQMMQQAQMKEQQSGQMIEQLTAKVHELSDQLESKQVENQTKAQADMAKAQLDAQTKLEIARMNNETELMKVQAQIMGAGVVPELQAKIGQLEQEHNELAELTLHHHDAITNPAEPVEEQEQVEPQPDPIHGILQQHGMALDSIGKALHRLGGPKKIITGPDGTPIGMEPVETEPALDRS